jgi:hypothetical protein
MDTLCCLPVNQFVFFLLADVYLAEKQQLSILYNLWIYATKNNNLEERGKIDTTNTQIRAWLATGTSIKSAGVKLGLWTQTSFLSEIMYV